MKVLFLDIDGVLATAETQRIGMNVFDPKCVQELHRIVQETGCKIVLSSTWRLGGLESIHDPLRNASIGKPEQLRLIMDALLDITPISDNMHRGLEIRQWIEENDFSGNFVIVDDDSFDMAAVSEQLVLTQFETGLTSKEADEIINMFSGQASSAHVG